MKEKHYPEGQGTVNVAVLVKATRAMFVRVGPWLGMKIGVGDNDLVEQGQRIVTPLDRREHDVGTRTMFVGNVEAGCSDPIPVPLGELGLEGDDHARRIDKAMKSPHRVAVVQNSD